MVDAMSVSDLVCMANYEPVYGEDESTGCRRVDGELTEKIQCVFLGRSRSNKKWESTMAGVSG